jgi:arylsulfatase A-like enzyme
MKWKWLALAGILLVAAIASRGSATRRPNVILISIDTLRADRLGCYGYAKPTTPAIDAFRAEAVLFRTAIASASSTLPSHATIFTALAPQHHGATWPRYFPLAARFVTLTELLRDAGYRTAAWVGGGQLSPVYGVNQGFESYDVVDDGTFDQIVARAVPFLERSKEKPFFLFLHTYQVHHPYWPIPEDETRFASPAAATTILPSYIDIRLLLEINIKKMGIGEGDRAHISDAYDAEIASMDHGFGRLIGELKRLGVYDNSLIVFTSDHGEEQGEHGYVGWHSHTLHEELLRVPLLVRFPAARHAGAEIGGVVGGIDVAPLILEATGIPRSAPFDHFSLATALARGRPPAAPILLWRDRQPSETVEHEGIRTADWKLIEGQLYDLRNDPREQKDVAASHPDIVNELTEQMYALIRKYPRPDTNAIAPDQETAQKLKALGYLH